MSAHLPPSATFTLSGPHLSQVTELLQLARRFAGSVGSGYGPHVQDALVALEETLSDQMAALERAELDDAALDEDTGQAERDRQAWRPLRAA